MVSEHPGRAPEVTVVIRHLPLALVFLLLGSACFAEPPDQEQTPCSLLIRVPRKTIEPPDQQVAHDGDVDIEVLGTRAVGRSTTSGTLHIALDERSREPLLTITFSGTSRGRTVGANGPAILYCSSTTRFECSRRITFNLEQGFVARPSVVQSKTQYTVDAVGSSQPGLRGRIVRRVAWRRERSSHGQATNIVARETQRELRRGFEQSVDEYLAGLNSQLKDVRQLALATNDKARLGLALAGPQRDTVVLYLADDLDQPVALPELTAGCQGAELWMRSPVASVALPSTVTSVLSQHFPSLGGALALAPLVNLSSPKLTSTLGYRSEGDWLIFGLSDPAAPPPDSDRIVVKKPVVEE